MVAQDTSGMDFSGTIHQIKSASKIPYSGWYCSPLIIPYVADSWGNENGRVDRDSRTLVAYCGIIVLYNVSESAKLI